MKSPGFLPSTDPEGFDREAFHQRLPGEVLEFLDGALRLEAVPGLFRGDRSEAHPIRPSFAQVGGVLPGAGADIPAKKTLGCGG
jgi:hypothetical protein